MYAYHMPQIKAHALSSPAGLVDVITFTLLTIQQTLPSVGPAMRHVKQHGRASHFLFGSKRAGYDYACQHAEVLFAAVTKAVEVNDVVGAVDVIANVPGLGPVKASFVAQMCGLEVACLDRHNLARLGLSESAFKTPKTLKPETRRAKIARYVEICAAAGTSEFWWDSWCQFTAGRRGSPLKTAEQVSAFHVEAVLG